MLKCDKPLVRRNGADCHFGGLVPPPDPRWQHIHGGVFRKWPIQPSFP